MTASQAVKRLLQRLLGRQERRKLADRAITFVLLNACFYLALLVFMLIFNISLLTLNLLLYISLSLFPLFFLIPSGQDRVKQTIRIIDSNCLIESFLDTSSREHRTFMEEPVKRLIERRTSEKFFPLRLSRTNRYFIAAALALLIIFQAANYLTLFRLSPDFSARNLKSRLVTIAAEQTAVLDDAGSPGRSAGLREPPPRSVGAGDAGGRDFNLDGTGDKIEEENPEGEADRWRRSFSEELGQIEEELSPDHRMPPGDSSTKGDLESFLENGAQSGEFQTQGKKGNRAAGSSSRDAGKGFLESPLKEYTTSPERIEAKGGDELSADSRIASAGQGLLLEALFGDFDPTVFSRSDFDPQLARIRQRYRELVNAIY